MGNEPLNTDCKRPDRGGDGRFRPGNRAARGHAAPYAAKVARLRRVLFHHVGPEQLGEIVNSLLAAAKAGDVAAAKALLSYALGPPEASDVLAKLEKLENLVQETTAL